MNSKKIRPDWVPAAYLEDAGTERKPAVPFAAAYKKPGGKTHKLTTRKTK